MSIIQFTSKQKEIIDGSLLGDGHLTRVKYGNSSFQKPQASRRREYLEWTYEELKPFSSRISDSDNKCKGKIYKRSTFNTFTHPHFSLLREKWYPSGIKIVPEDLELTPLCIAIWFFDDGSNCVKSRCANFSTYSFTKQECDSLVVKLKKFDIHSYVDKRNVIIVYTKSYGNIIDLVKSYMLWDCFSYKILYRDAEFTLPTDEEIELINFLYDQYLSVSEVAKKVGRSISCVSKIVRNNKNSTLALNNTSGFTGVYWDKSRNKWIAHIKTKNIGRFNSKEEAAIARSNYVKTDNTDS